MGKLQLGDGRRYYRSAVECNFQPVSNRFSDHLGIDLVISPYGLDSSGVRRVAREHDAAGVFAPEHELGEKPARSQVHSSAHTLRERLLRQGDRDSAIGAIMR